MARASVTYSDVARAASDISDEGENPTVDRVRTRLGSGSNSTISPLLKRWKQENTFERAGSTLPIDVLAAIKKLHGQLQDQAQAQVDRYKEQWSREKQTNQETITALHHQITLLKKERDMMQEQKAEQRQVREQLENKLNRLVERHDALTVECKQLNQENRALLVDINTYKTASALYQQTIKTLESTVADFEKKESNHQVDHDALVAENARLEEKLKGQKNANVSQ